MSEVASRELRNSTRSVLDRVARGEQVTITVDGRPVAEMHPIGRRPRWTARADFVLRLASAQADVGLTDDLADLAGETTDERPIP